MTRVHGKRKHPLGQRFDAGYGNSAVDVARKVAGEGGLVGAIVDCVGDVARDVKGEFDAMRGAHRAMFGGAFVDMNGFEGGSGGWHWSAGC